MPSPRSAGSPREGQTNRLPANKEEPSSIGRTPLPPEKRRSASIKFRVTPRERQAVEQRAAELGLSLSSYARKRVLGRPLLPMSMRGVQGAIQAIVVEVRRLHETRAAGSDEPRREEATSEEMESEMAESASDLARALGRLEAMLEDIQGRG